MHYLFRGITLIQYYMNGILMSTPVSQIWVACMHPLLVLDGLSALTIANKSSGKRCHVAHAAACTSSITQSTSSKTKQSIKPSTHFFSQLPRAKVISKMKLTIALATLFASASAFAPNAGVSTRAVATPSSTAVK